MAANMTMHRGVQQALYKYLPGSWADYTQSGGGRTYAVYVETWNSIPLLNVNNKRLLRVINQHVHSFASQSPQGMGSLVNFASAINEENYDVLTPKVSDQVAAIQTVIKPWVFVCSSCGKVRQFYSYDELKKREHERCSCGNHFTQLRMIRYCKCGYADGIFVPKCSEPGHGTTYMVRRGSGADFVCSKCGRKAIIPRVCPECHQKLDVKPAFDSAHYYSFTLSLIDLLDKRKDIFIENETEGKGERVILAQYLNLLSQELYSSIIEKGKIPQNDELERSLEAEASIYRSAGLDEATIAMVIDAKRKADPSGDILNAISKVDQGISIASTEELTPLAEEILEYDELKNAKIILTLSEAEDDAEKVNDGIRPNYVDVSRKQGFSNIQLCSRVPIIFSAYGYTRKEKEPKDGIKLHGFPQEMAKKNVYATRLETEGILLELDRDRLLAWLVENGLIDEQDLPNDMSEYGQKLWFLDRVRPNRILPFSEIEDNDSNGRITKRVYTLLHSIAHVLISEAAELCGLDKNSLSEYILPNIPAIFIYCSNSQGFDMGALYSMFQTHLDKWLLHAKERAQKCIFDPVCISREKACAGCLFLNEVSCRHFNKDLDRSYLCGYYDVVTHVKLHGFWED